MVHVTSNLFFSLIHFRYPPARTVTVAVSVSVTVSVTAVTQLESGGDVTVGTGAFVEVEPATASAVEAESSSSPSSPLLSSDTESELVPEIVPASAVAEGAVTVEEADP